MTTTAPKAQDFGDVKQRLEQIAAAVADENMPLDEALDLFEEAVSLGMQVTDLLEVGLEDSVDPVAAPEEGPASTPASGAETE